ncbi:hypothetical protein HY463_00660 [Candidatus Peregrinibacteria bacterium]|nr:hypothetical protein [Candidatus Peregrinibacteria bacterium]
MFGIDKEELKQRIDSANPEQLAQVAAIFGVQDDTREQVGTAMETMEADPRLAKYAEMYGRWSAVSKSRLDWSRVRAAMLADDGALLRKAEAIPKGPIMFGADKDGNILFANGGLEPILTGRPYFGARKAAKYIGLALFPYVEPYEKSEEELQFEAFTGEPLVRFAAKTKWASSWLESGKNDGNVGNARISAFYPGRQQSSVGNAFAKNAISSRGVRGLLRAKA